MVVVVVMVMVMVIVLPDEGKKITKSLVLIVVSYEMEKFSTLSPVYIRFLSSCFHSSSSGFKIVIWTQICQFFALTVLLK